ncbi:MAG: hypothetical protein QXN34_06920 [Archaeoglobaceae archaeon]
MRTYIFTKKERALLLNFIREKNIDDPMLRMLISRINESRHQLIFDFKLMLRVLTILEARNE